jgi:hypothetical protein
MKQLVLEGLGTANIISDWITVVSAKRRLKMLCHTDSYRMMGVRFIRSSTFVFDEIWISDNDLLFE